MKKDGSDGEVSVLGTHLEGLGRVRHDRDHPHRNPVLC